MSSKSFRILLASDAGFCSWQTCDLLAQLHLCLVNWLHLDLVGSVHTLKSGWSSHIPSPGSLPYGLCLWDSFASTVGVLYVRSCIGAWPPPLVGLFHTPGTSGVLTQVLSLHSISLLWRHPVRRSLSQASHKEQRKHPFAFGFPRPIQCTSSF